MNLYKKYTAKPYSSVATDASFTSDNTLHFRIKISLRIWNVFMTIDCNTRDKKTILWY